MLHFHYFSRDDPYGGAAVDDTSVDADDATDPTPSDSKRFEKQFLLSLLLECSGLGQHQVGQFIRLFNPPD